MLLFTLGFRTCLGRGGLFGVAGEEDVACNEAADVFGFFHQVLLDPFDQAFVAVLHIVVAGVVVDVAPISLPVPRFRSRP